MKTLKVQDNVPNIKLTFTLRYGEYCIGLSLITPRLKFDHFLNYDNVR